MEERDSVRNSLILVESQAKEEHYEQMVSVPEHLEVGAPEGKAIKYVHVHCSVVSCSTSTCTSHVTNTSIQGIRTAPCPIYMYIYIATLAYTVCAMKMCRSNKKIGKILFVFSHAAEGVGESWLQTD